MVSKTPPLRSDRAARRTAMALAAAGLFSFAAPARAIDVPTFEVQARGAASTVELQGVVQPVRQATVAAQVGGNVMAVAVAAGDRVRAGQLIARVDERETQAGLQRSEAAVLQAEVEARNARLNAERTRELRGQGFVSQAALDTAESQWRATSAAVEQARAGRAQAALARGFTAAAAPFDGIVLATHAEAGDLAAPGRPLATVYAPDAMRVVVHVGVSQAARVRAAGPAEIELPDGRRVAPVRRTELSTADPVAQTIEWRLDLPADVAAAVRPGQMVTVRLQAAAGVPPAAAAVPQLPASAVLRRGELTGAYVARDGAFVLRAVRLGVPAADGMQPVLAGLRPGERVALDAVQAGLAGARPVK
jgi:RND family efflux transporter MFP subunit